MADDECFVGWMFFVAGEDVIRHGFDSFVQIGKAVFAPAFNICVGAEQPEEAEALEESGACKEDGGEGAQAGDGAVDVVVVRVKL